ncbi:50S ribosomal protein L25 [bacterium]|nr:50S ribosomal protein L25 [bacterium]
MENIMIPITRRDPGKKAVKAARNAKMIPIEIYGPAVKHNISASVERKEMVKALHTPQGKNVLITFDLEGEKIKVVPYQFQIHEVKHNIQHIDCLAVNDGDVITLDVPVLRDGRSLGETAGGMVIIVIKNVKVQCKPADIPASLVVDVTDLDIGARVKISELPYPEGVTPLYKQDSPVIVVNKGRGQTAEELEEEEAAEAAAAAAAAEGTEAAAGDKAPAKGDKAPAKE